MTRFYLFTTGFFVASASLFQALGHSPFPLPTAILLICLLLLHKMVEHFPAFKRKGHSIGGIVFISVTLQAVFFMSGEMGGSAIRIPWTEMVRGDYNTLCHSLLLKTLLLNLTMAVPLYAALKKAQIPVQRVLFLTATPAIPLAALFFTPDQILTALLFGLHTTLIFSGSHITGFIAAGTAAALAPWQAAALPFLITRRNCKQLPVMILPLSAIWIWNGCYGFDTPPLSFFAANEIQTTGFLLHGTILGMIWLTVHNPVRGLFLFMGFVALLKPAAGPLLIMMPLAAMCASFPWIFLCTGLLLSAAAMKPPFFENPEALLQAGLVYLVFAAIVLRKAWRTGPAPAMPYNRVKTLSVIIPTLNEEQNIKACLRSLYNQQGVKRSTAANGHKTDRTLTNVNPGHRAENHGTGSTRPELSLPGHLQEIIVADGGSSDQTLSIAESAGARAVNSRKGRGCQIADAIKTTSADVVLILHADCTLEKDATQKILRTLNNDRTLAGGAFFMKFAPTDPKKRLVSFLNNLRAATTGISFGDQGQFARREALTQCSGFPDQMLMEDVELSLRLKNHGRLTLIPGRLTVSGRRWDTRGFSSNFTTVIRLFTTYLIRRRLGFENQDDRTYYKAYYKE